MANRCWRKGKQRCQFSHEFVQAHAPTVGLAAKTSHHIVRELESYWHQHIISASPVDAADLTLDRLGPLLVIIAPVVRLELERIEALELMGMVLAHLNDAEAVGELSPRVPLLMSIRDKLADELRGRT